MHSIHRYFYTLAYLLGIHLAGLLILSLFRLSEFIVLHSLITQPDAPVWPAFVRGVWFDNVIGCYLLLVPLAVGLGAAVASYYPHALRKGIAWWFALLYAIVFAISAANAPYFQYFFKNINASIFEWFGYPGTTVGMVMQEPSYWMHIGLFVLCTAAFVFALRKLRRWADYHIATEQPDAHGLRPVAIKLLLTLACIGLCIFGIRGRTGYNPIKVSQAYYCNDPLLNQLGISPAFNLFRSALDDMSNEKRELRLMPDEEAISYTRMALGLTDPVQGHNPLMRSVKASGTLRKHNVVIILMESMSAHWMQTFGQKEPLTPTLDSLYRHSLAFTHFYSAGIHTNHGITASLYSFPALMFRNLMKGAVTPQRHGLPGVLQDYGYHNLFFMTHEGQYDNMKAFLSTNGYHDIYAQENYPRREVVNSFGVPDRFLFNYALPVIDRQAATGQPFMATLLTISNHPPYIVPTDRKYRTQTPETQIVEYADAAIAEFLRHAAQRPWYANTVFVLLADHGKRVGKSEAELPQSYNHIPLLIFGPDVPEGRYEGQGMQVDLMPTLLSLLGMDYRFDGFGVDLLNHPRDMVFYSADNQIVARDASRCYIYNPKLEKSFCYDVLPDGQLRLSTHEEAFAPLRRYVFAMIQTAQYMLKESIRAPRTHE